MTVDELLKYVLPMASEWQKQNEFGALHIVVSDGNVEDEHIEYCLKEPNITESEREFANRLLEDYTESQRHMVWELTHCDDVRP
jgi:hypothetical protein